MNKQIQRVIDGLAGIIYYVCGIFNLMIIGAFGFAFASVGGWDVFLTFVFFPLLAGASSSSIILGTQLINKSQKVEK
ncbi:hypothetical protein DRH27_04245 [Candidatus Falkowbacteria bacterium]|nr:MAG: hypothetical protein DRH27_04245 [Candidatus Falkowbacteria bacterium]